MYICSINLDNYGTSINDREDGLTTEETVR